MKIDEEKLTSIPSVEKITFKTTDGQLNSQQQKWKLKDCNGISKEQKEKQLPTWYCTAEKISIKNENEIFSDK